MIKLNWIVELGEMITVRNFCSLKTFFSQLRKQR